MKLTNLELGLEPKTTLFKEEVDVILAVVEQVIRHDGSPPKAGTFLLFGVKNGETEPQRIIAGDFGRGPKRNFAAQERSSRQIAEEVLSRDVWYGEREYSTITYFDLGATTTPEYLHLKTTHGHFSCAYYVDNAIISDMDFVYCAVAQTLANMGKEDTELQKGCGKLFADEVDIYPGLYALQDFVNDLFEKCELPELKAWKAWHEPANASGELTLFFE